jgi:hypothetical protein
MDVALVGLSLPGVENHAIGALRAALRTNGLDEAFVPFGGFASLEPNLRDVLALRPGVVGVSLQTIESALAVVVFTLLLRKRGFRGRIVLGGHFATLNAGDLLLSGAGIDAVVRFAGEEALVEIARGALDDPERRNRIPGVVFVDDRGDVKRGAPPKWTSPTVLAQAARFEPLPEHLGFVAADLVASRGCESHCGYCCIAGVSDLARRESGGADAAYERRPLESLAAEIAELHHQYGACVFNFMDDNVLPREPEEAARWAASLRERLDAKRVGPLAFSIQVRADTVSERSAWALARLGLARAYVGIDGYSPSQLRVLGRRADAGAGPRATELLSRNGVFSVVNALLVGPTIPFESVLNEIEGLSKLQHAPVHLLPIEVRAGTSYFRAAERRGLVEGGFLHWHYRFADRRTQRMAEIITSFPTRLTERSVPIALYDLGYNLGIARRLAPEVGIAEFAATFDRIAAEWNRDQIRVLRGAAIAAVADESDAAAAFVAREMNRVTELDQRLRDAADRSMSELERLVSHVRRRHVSLHARGKLLGSVAFSMSLAACGGTVTESGNPANTRTDASLGGGGTSGAGNANGGSTSGSGGVLSSGSGGVFLPPPPPAPYRPSVFDAAQTTCTEPSRQVGTSRPKEDGYELDVTGCGGDYLVTFDDQGRAVGFRLSDGDAGGSATVDCLRRLLQNHCYPSFAGKTIHAFIPHSWIA